MLLVSVALGAATLATAILVFALSLRLRRREMETMRKIGAGRARLRAILATEVLAIAAGALVLAGLLTLALGALGDVALRLVTG